MNIVYDYLRVGKIANTQGIKGEVRIIPLTDDVNRFSVLTHILIDNEKQVSLDIEYVKQHKNFVLLKFKGIDSINEAEKFKGYYILIERSNAIKLPEGSFFIGDVIGLNVYTTNEDYIGEVQDIIATGSNDVYVVSDGSKEILIPALKTIVKNISIEDRKIIVELPEGLV